MAFYFFIFLMVINTKFMNVICLFLCVQTIIKSTVYNFKENALSQYFMNVMFQLSENFVMFYLKKNISKIYG